MKYVMIHVEQDEGNRGIMPERYFEYSTKDEMMKQAKHDKEFFPDKAIFVGRRNAKGEILERKKV